MAGNVGGRVAVGIVCCWGFALTALLFFYAVNPWIDHREIPVFHSLSSNTVLFGAAGLIFLFVIARLIQGRRWAWWTAFAVSILILGLGAFFFYSSLQDRMAFERSERLRASIIVIMPTAMCSVLLALPCVRRRFMPL
jgi:hypothetical protein